MTDQEKVDAAFTSASGPFELRSKILDLLREAKYEERQWWKARGVRLAKDCSDRSSEDVAILIDNSYRYDEMAEAGRSMYRLILDAINLFFRLTGESPTHISLTTRQAGLLDHFYTSEYVGEASLFKPREDGRIIFLGLDTTLKARRFSLSSERCPKALPKDMPAREAIYMELKEDGRVVQIDKEGIEIRTVATGFTGKDTA